MKDGKVILKDMILGLLVRAKSVAKTRLAKLVLFTEIEHFCRTGDSITGLYFVRLKKGPVIAFFDEVLEEGTGTLWDKVTTQIPIREEGRLKVQYSYTPKTKVQLSTEIEATIDKVCKEYGDMTGTALSHCSHDLPAWKYSEPNEPMFIAELSIKDDAEYFALTDLVEDFDDDEILAEKLSQALYPSEVSI